MFNAVFGDNVGFVSKVDVSDLRKSVEWYSDKIGLVPDEEYATATWTQLNVPGIPLAGVGLNAANDTGTGGGVITFVVEDIDTARANLLDKGVQVGPVETVADNVRLAFFQDPDGNSLGLRQNP